MTLTPVYAPYATTYAVHEPYLTVDEYTASPTGVNIGNLVSGGGAAAQKNAIATTLNRASSWADQICNQVLAATVETALGLYRIQDGVLRIPVPFSPVVQVNGYSSGPSADQLVPATSLVGVSIEEKVLTLPASQFGATRQYVTVEYVSGFANSVLRAASAVGDTTVTVDNTLGVVPGMALQINDPMTGSDEVQTVASMTDTTITFTTALVYAHGLGVNVSALPAAIKQAVIYLASSIIRGRASQAMVIPNIQSAPTQVQGMDPLVRKLTGDAIGLLQPFARVI